MTGYEQDIREARLAAGYTLEQIAEITKIPKSSLALLEDAAYEALPAPVFVRGFIRNYAKVLGLDPSPFLQQYENSSAAGSLKAQDGDAFDHDPNKPPSSGQLAGKFQTVHPLSMRQGSGIRSGMWLVAFTALTLLVVAWFLVGSKSQSSLTSARDRVEAPFGQNHSNGMPSFDSED